MQVPNFKAFPFAFVAATWLATLSSPVAIAQQQAAGAGSSDRSSAAQSAPERASSASSKRQSARKAQSGDSASSAAPSAKKERSSRRGKARKPRAFEGSPGPGRSGGALAAAAGAGAVAMGADGAGSSSSAAKPSPVRQTALASPAVPRPSIGEAIGLKTVSDPLALHSSVALVVDSRNGEVLVRKNAGAVLPIASITKLMTAMVVIDAGLPLAERLQITRDDIDRLRHTSSRLHPGAWLSRSEMLHLALMSSENRAANALGRHYPGGMPAFVAAMNAKARALGMHDTRFVEPTGLSSANVSSGRDLAQLVRTASGYPLIKQYSTARSLTVQPGREPLGFYNTNRLISTAGWSIGLQKTGFISEAGNCLVMMANVDGRPLIFVLLDAAGKLARFGDAQRIRNWVEKSHPSTAPVHASAAPASRAAPLRVSLGAH